MVLYNWHNKVGMYDSVLGFLLIKIFFLQILKTSLDGIMVNSRMFLFYLLLYGPQPNPK